MAIMLAGLALAAAGVAEGMGEIAPHLSAATGPGQRFAAIAAGAYLPGDSRWSRDLFLTDCLDLPATTMARVQPPARQAAFAKTCRTVAQAAVATIPTNSAAWLVLTASSLGHPVAFRASLLASARTAPDVHWLAERRSALAAAHPDLLDDTSNAAWRRDLAALTGSYPGLDVLAARYTHDATQREAIIAVVEATPPDRQRAFLDRVRNLSGRAP